MLHRLAVEIHRIVIQLAFVYVKLAELDLALQARQRVVVELDLALGHAANHDDLLVLCVRKALVNFWTIKEFKRDFLDDAILLVNVTRKLNYHVRVAIRHNETLLQDEVLRVVDAYEGARAIS